MSLDIAYVGTYTKPLPHVDGHADGIYTITFDQKTGIIDFKQKEAFEAGLNPSYLHLTQNAHGKKFLFAANEGNVPPNSVRSFEVKEDGSLKGVDKFQDDKMLSPCYVSSVSGGSVLLVANYLSGNINSFKVSERGTLNQVYFEQFEGAAMVNAARQEAPHAHSIVPSPKESIVLVADLGRDRILIYTVDDHGVLFPFPAKNKNFVEMPPGSGPRHLVFHPSKPYVYVTFELSSQVAMLIMNEKFTDAEDGKQVFEVAQVTSTLPKDFHQLNHVAEIHISAKGEHLYVSNRGHDSISHFTIGPNGFLKECCHVLTPAKTPRGFTIARDEKFMLVAGQDNDIIVVLGLKDDTGCPFLTDKSLSVPTPVCIVFA